MMLAERQRARCRRRMMGIVLIGLLVVTLPPVKTMPAAHDADVASATMRPAADNPIVLENQQPGSGDWFWTKMGDDATGQIKGYASATSVKQNENITFHVTVNPAQTYTIDFYRMGWYGGLGARLRLHVGPLAGVQQPPCDSDATTGLIACNWAPSYTLTVPSDWTSGIYAARLTNEQGYQNYVAVRRPRRPPRAVPVPTERRDGAGVQQLSQRRPHGQEPLWLQQLRCEHRLRNPAAVKVSFDRPMADSGIGDLFINWEINLIRWLERSGYDVTYSTDLDTHANGGELREPPGVPLGRPR